MRDPNNFFVPEDFKEPIKCIGGSFSATQKNAIEMHGKVTCETAAAQANDILNVAIEDGTISFPTKTQHANPF